MKKAIKLVASSAFMLLFLASCGESDSTSDASPEASNENKEPVKEEVVCEESNDIYLEISKYGYQFDESFEYKGKLEIVRTDWTKMSDSTATLSLYNYALGVEEADTNFEIRVNFRARHGKLLEETAYPYSDYQADFDAGVTIICPKGTVYFNWNMGMPEQGTVSIVHLNDKNVCGKFKLKVDKQDSKTIGKVVLDGIWNTAL